MFASRDIWFVVALPVYFTTFLDWSHSLVGGFMALWIIGYGIVQGFAPRILKHWTGEKSPSGKMASNISLLLTVVMVLISILFGFNIYTRYIITIGLIIFGAVFALNSSVHSFLVLDYAKSDKAAANVGFYYMANAIGRLIGTLLSGFLFQIGGILWALIGSGIFLFLSFLITQKLKRV